MLSTVGSMLRRPKQDAGKKTPNMREEVNPAGPPLDRESIHELMIVSPTHAEEIMLDRSAEDPVNILNYLALKDVSNSSPKPTVPSKRKRQDTDVVVGSSEKRVAKGTGIKDIKDTRDESATTSINGVTRRQGRSSRTASNVENAASGKLPRPKKKPQKRHIADVDPAVQNGNDMWIHPATPTQQVEKVAPPPTTPTRDPPSSEATPRPRGRPRRVGPSAGQNASKTKTRPYSKRPSSDRKLTADRRSTRSVASANGQKDLILNADIDLTKKPERDARRSAKQARNLKLASEAPAQERDRTVARNAPITKNHVQARARKASPKVQNHVVGEEHEEEEEQEVSEREERTNSVEVHDRDGQMSSYLDEREGGTEGEEDESLSESSAQVVENEEEAEGHETMELFGQDRAWKVILEGAQSVCGSKLPLNRMPTLLTKTIGDLVQDVKEARELYEQLLTLKGIDHDSVVELNNLLKTSLDAIDGHINGLSEKRAATTGSKMIRDIYACAIPAMVFLLQSALATRKYHSDEPCDLRTLNCIVEGLEEIIRLQTMAMELCEKAGTWKAKPVSTSRPVIWPTTRKMFPNLRLMQGTFSKHLLEQKRKRKVKENAFKTAQKQEDLLQSSQQASQEAARINDRRNRKLRECLEEEAEKHRNANTSYRQGIANDLQARTQSQQVNGRIESSDHWSVDEDLELYIQLEKGYDPGLTSTSTRRHPLCQRSSLITLVANERYLKILNAPALQNKLPSHIRKRALYDKTFLLDQEGPLEWITSIE